MKFVAVADTHGCHRQLELPVGDVFIHAGDVCDRGDRAQAADFFDWIGQLDFSHKLLIWGNHDFDLPSGELLFPASLPPGVFVLDRCGCQIGDVNIWGTPTPSSKRNEDWNQIPDSTDVVLTHRPPHGILDTSRIRGSQGSRSLAARIRQIKPRVHVFGHIHHSYGTQVQGPTTFINASLYRSTQQRLVNAPITFELGGEKST